MPRISSHIPFLKTIDDFFRVYRLGKPLHPEIMCMKLEDQPDEKLMHMPLYRANFFRVILFTNAQLHFISGEKEHDVFNNCLCFTYPGKLESWTRTGRLYGYVIYFTPAFAGLDITRPDFDNTYPFFNFNAESVLPLADEEADDLKQQANEMIKEIYSDTGDKLDMVKKLLLIYLHRIKRIYYKKVNSLSPEIKASKTLYNRFRQELDNYMQQLSAQQKNSTPTVSAIAKNLSVNASYLNSIIKNLTGKTASAHIQEKTILEAKSFLIHTDLQVTEIAFRLGFENTSYFNRFFKKTTGIVPSAFRKQFVKS
jgi:AraC family transcriptional regulator, transcriptional activator of pobA